jgi:2-C-methyl-D-erythritol 2,4-cyclodiphosphate synthase
MNRVCPLIRIGQGIDFHRFSPRRRLILGGVDIPWDFGLEGHSDADVLTHALMDALLGAIGLPDIGARFPNTEMKWKDCSSLIMLEDVVNGVVSAGWTIGNVDTTLVLEAPKVMPHAAAIKQKLGGVLRIPVDAISLKATTSETMGAMGRGEGVAAFAVALVMKTPES